MGGMNGNRNLFCPWGLELKTPINLRIHKMHKEEAIRSVLQAQENPSCNNPELVATAYASYSTQSLEEAKVVATME